MNDKSSKTQTTASSYDTVPYTSHPFSQTHPDNLATVAHLFGLQPKTVQNYRVLEIGCALGGNIVHMAEQFPDSTFVGFDLSEVQIAEARKTAQAAGLENIELMHLDIIDVSSDLGEFDYIICHGIYSWVPDKVQDKVLKICMANLAPHGVAYVSYNTYPGWNMRGTIRDMMVYHGRKFDEPRRRVSEAKGLLQFMSQAVSEDRGAYGMMLKSELELLNNCADSYLFHDHLEEVNEPIYFHQFMDRVADKRLQYLGEASLSAMFLGNFPDEVTKTLRGISTDVIETEQYMDFLRNRSFRQTLLCHADAKISRSLMPSSLQGLHVTSPLAPVDTPVDIQSGTNMKFQVRRSDRTIDTGDPLTKAAFCLLAERWPESMPYDELVSMAMSRAGAESIMSAERVEQANNIIASGILRCYVSGIIEFSTQPTRFTTAISDRPQATKLARLHAKDGNLVTNRQHKSVPLSDLNRQVLRHLNDERDRERLLDALVQLTKDGTLTVQKEGRPIESADELRSNLSEALEQSLEQLAASALLIS